jgi:hypothetical protein
MADTRFRRLDMAALRPRPQVFDTAKLFSAATVAPASEVRTVVAGARLVDGLRLGRLVENIDLIRLPPGRVVTGGALVAQSQAPHPVSPQPTPTDTLVYTDGADPAITFFLPRYRLRTAVARYDIAMAAEVDGQWSIAFGLETHPAPELANAARTARPMPHELMVVLRYFMANTAIEKQFPAFALNPDDNGLRVQFHMSLEERDAVLRAFRSDSAQARLDITRLCTVCVPVAPDSVEDVPHQPVLPVGGGRRLLYPGVGSPMSPRPMRPGQLLMGAKKRITPAAGLRADLLRAPVDLIAVHRPMPFPGPVPVPAPAPAPPPASAPSIPMVMTTPQSLPVAVPLRFDAQEHPYLFPSGAVAATGAEIERVLLRHPADDTNGRLHAYFRDLARPNLFYFLPDAFKLSRTHSAPFVPGLSVRMGQGASAEATQVHLAALVRPEVDADRLEAARAALKARALGAQPSSAGALAEIAVELEPLQAKAVLKLGLPQAGLVQTVETPAEVDLANGFVFEQHVDFADFQDIFAALVATGGVSTLLRGSVIVNTGLPAQDLVPVDLRFADMEGEVFIYDEQTDAGRGGVTASLRNVTESPLVIEGLRVWLQREGAQTLGRVSGLDLSVPQVVEPDASVTLSIEPEQALPGTGPLDAIFDLSRVKSRPDPARILPLVLDESVAPDCTRAVTVMTAADLLGDGTDPDQTVRLILLEFRGNRRVTLDASRLQADVEVPVPLLDVLLRRDTEGTYRYRQTVIYKSGRQVLDPAWRQTDLGVLFVPVA